MSALNRAIYFLCLLILAHGYDTAISACGGAIGSSTRSATRFDTIAVEKDFIRNIVFSRDNNDKIAIHFDQEIDSSQNLTGKILLFDKNGIKIPGTVELIYEFLLGSKKEPRPKAAPIGVKYIATERLLPEEKYTVQIDRKILFKKNSKSQHFQTRTLRSDLKGSTELFSDLSDDGIVLTRRIYPDIRKVPAPNTGDSSNYKWTFNVGKVVPKTGRFQNSAGGVGCGKPVIYLYPTEKTDVHVELNFAGTLDFTYPQYRDEIRGWKVTAFPDGRLIDRYDQREYSYLFWEGDAPNQPLYDMSKGFVVKGSDTTEFLRETLSKLGLKPNELNDMIVFWLPRMKNNPYNLIHFAFGEFEKIAPLSITPKPDSLLRVFMVYERLENKIQVTPQELPTFVRKGFSAVEWGGAELNSNSLYNEKQ